MAASIESVHRVYNTEQPPVSAGLIARLPRVPRLEVEEQSSIDIWVMLLDGPLPRDASPQPSTSHEHLATLHIVMYSYNHQSCTFNGVSLNGA